MNTNLTSALEITADEKEALKAFVKIIRKKRALTAELKKLSGQETREAKNAASKLDDQIDKLYEQGVRLCVGEVHTLLSRVEKKFDMKTNDDTALLIAGQIGI